MVGCGGGEHLNDLFLRFFRQSGQFLTCVFDVQEEVEGRTVLLQNGAAGSSADSRQSLEEVKLFFAKRQSGFGADAEAVWPAGFAQPFRKSAEKNNCP